MVDMGAEVGQKMRSAIKAKLTELECYVDDELPDYIMVMVANKRTKAQMNEDLALFLNKKTSMFVDWLHIVLKKLKEVTVTNLDVYKKGSKRKSSEKHDAKIEQKRIKKESLNNSNETVVKKEVKGNQDKSLTDDLPFNVKVESIAENRKITLVSSTRENNQNINIQPLAEIEQPRLKELEDIESQIKSVKSRLGFKIDQEVDESELQRIIEENKNRSAAVEISSTESRLHVKSKYETEQPTNESEDQFEGVEECNVDNPSVVRKEHSKIVFSKEDFISSPKKKSVLDRLGKYGAEESKSVLCRLGNYGSSNEKKESESKRGGSRYGNGRKLKGDIDSSIADKNRKFVSNEKTGFRKESGKDLRIQLSQGISGISKKKDIKKRLGLSSKVTIPPIDPQLLDDTFKKREVVSVIKVKPRILPPSVQQANKNLLLKAVADAQKSIAQSKSVGRFQRINSPITKNSDVQHEEPTQSFVHRSKKKKVSQEGKEILRQFLSSQSGESSDQEYIPASINDMTAEAEYFPSSLERKAEEIDENVEKKHKFIVTLDGIQQSDMVARLSVKDRLDGRKTPSPIIFGGDNGIPKTERKIPDKLPIVPISIVKKKEKCKYFPSCKNGQRCEFIHPVKLCEQFPYCKFGNECLYIHPSCKFGNSCTKRDCPYTHSSGYGTGSAISLNPVKPQIAKSQICKFFPKCINMTCPFYHPKPCKFGVYCKNQSTCHYSHTTFPSQGSLTWRSK